MTPYEITDVGKHWFIIYYLHHYKIIANSIEPSNREQGVQRTTTPLSP